MAGDRDGGHLSPMATYDAVVVGSGFGGSVSAMRLAQKGYSVLVLERGKRFADADFARTNWNLRRYLWAPALRCFGILQISTFRNVVALHGSGVGGGSLGYGMVLMEPDERMFSAPAWHRFADWKAVLRPHYDEARRMLGVAPNPRLEPADEVLREIARGLGREATFRPTPVGAFFVPGREGEEFPDPYFGGEGPARHACRHCGACMVGCRYDAKNTLPKNYLYFAERWGARIEAEREVRDIRPLPPDQPDGARYEIEHRSSTALLRRAPHTVRARRVVLAAGTLGTLRLLFRCRDVTRSLPGISPRLGDMVRTNSESLLGVGARGRETDYSRGVAITSIFQADAVTAIEPVRYPAGSSAMRYLSGPIVTSGGLMKRLAVSVWAIVRRPADFLRSHFLAGWAERTTILLVMQTEDNRIRLRLGRSPLTLFRRDLVSLPDEEATIPSKIPLGHEVAHEFARRVNGIALGSINEGLFDVPMTAHILGGCPIGHDAGEGVVTKEFELHGHPGIHVADGSIMPANPGVNPSLTITALAEYAMSQIPPKSSVRPPVEASLPGGLRARLPGGEHLGLARGGEAGP